ncbi:mechanosensitive ion channel family protein [Cuniculiplasma sp. SKW3]|uniref:mechanosensitive ion channel family protein n=1 Tax=Cuniculiplasma sp. SKW3 TaxID=3400170 RepID=UPI003FD4B890
MTPAKSNRYAEFKLLILLIVGILVIIAFQQIIFPYLYSYFPTLKSYDRYLRYALGATVIFGIAAGILSVLKRMVERVSDRSNGKNYRGIYAVLRAVIYGGAIAAFLAYIGISLTGALIGGTVGGLILSFALQNTVSNLLSGLLLTTAGVLKPKGTVSFFSWLFDNPVVGEVVDVKLLTVQVLTIDGNITELPNTGLLGQTQFTNLNVGDIIRASILVTLPVDAQIKGIMEMAQKKIESMKEELGLLSIESYFFTKTFNSNTIKIIFNFKKILKYNGIVSAINLAFEESYWEMKNRTPQGNNIILGFPTDVPIKSIQELGDSKLESKRSDVGIIDFHSTFFIKNSTINSLKITFNISADSKYDQVANAINYSYEDAYLELKNKVSNVK